MRCRGSRLEHALDAHEVGADLGQALPSTAEHGRRVQRREERRVDAGPAERELPAAQLRDAVLRVEQQLRREVAERDDRRAVGSARAGGRATARTPRSRRAADRGCRAAGTSRRSRCRRRRAAGRCPRSAASAACPARPTNGSPCRSSCCPGPSPTNSRSASARPTPNTTCVRPAASLHNVQSCASAATSSRVAAGALAGCEEALSDTGDAIRGRPPHESTRRRRRRPPPAGDRGARRPCRSHSATARSPSKRVWDGRRLRAIPSCALCATRWQPSLSHRPSVTTTTSVVFAVSSNGCGSGKPGASAGAVDPASTRPSSPTTSPTALTTAIAATVASSTRRVRRSEAAGYCVVATAPLADRRAGAGTSPPDFERVVALAHDRGRVALGRGPGGADPTRGDRRSPRSARSAPARQRSRTRGRARRGSA